VLGGVYCDKDAVDDELVDIILAPAFTPNALDVFVSVITGGCNKFSWWDVIDMAELCAPGSHQAAACMLPVSEHVAVICHADLGNFQALAFTPDAVDVFVSVITGGWVRHMTCSH
jgi:hypothetical protein